MKPRAAAVIIEGERLLVVRRKRETKEYSVLPGGSIEFGECPEAACCREVKEETGLDVEILKRTAITARVPIVDVRGGDVVVAWETSHKYRFHALKRNPKCM